MLKPKETEKKIIDIKKWLYNIHLEILQCESKNNNQESKIKSIPKPESPEVKEVEKSETESSKIDRPPKKPFSKYRTTTTTPQKSENVFEQIE